MVDGTIDVTAPGYREFHMSLARIEGGFAFTVPTRSLESDRPYPSRVSFAEWDVLYTKTEFVTCSGNDTDCDVGIEIRDLSKPATLTLRERSSDKVYASASLQPSGGVATAAFSGTLLQEGSSNALPPGGEFFMQFETSDAIYEFPIALGVKKVVAEKFSIEPHQDLAPCNSNLPVTPQITVPDYDSSCPETGLCFSSSVLLSLFPAMPLAGAAFFQPFRTGEAFRAGLHNIGMVLHKPCIEIGSALFCDGKRLLQPPFLHLCVVAGQKNGRHLLLPPQGRPRILGATCIS